MGGFQPWHWLIVLVLLAIVVVVVVVAVVVVRALTKPKPPTNNPSTAAPGWYPDPRDPTAMRYFDGRDWIRSDGPRN